MSMHRVEELLAEQSLWGWEDSERVEFERLAATQPSLDVETSSKAWEIASAAATHTLASRCADPIPAGLISKLEADATQFLVSEHGLTLSDLTRSDPVTTPAASRAAVSKAVVSEANRVDRSPLARRSQGSALGWVAAAAAATIALTLWLSRPATEPTVDMAAAAMLASPGVDKLELGPGPSEFGKDVRGDVLWNPTTGQGYLRLAGLPSSEGSTFQYQLWIFDDSRDDHPVDGGLFDVAADGSTTVVGIRPPVPVGEASLFAVTREARGGVVVSKQEYIVAVAKP